MSEKPIIKKLVVRQIKVPTPKIKPLVTDPIDKTKALVKSKTGKFIEVNNLTKDLQEFLEKEFGATVDLCATEAIRGKTELAGVKVKILPISNTYDKGAYIQVSEPNELSYENTNKVTAFLAKNGINWEKECILTEEKACNTKK